MLISKSTFIHIPKFIKLLHFLSAFKENTLGHPSSLFINCCIMNHQIVPYSFIPFLISMVSFIDMKQKNHQITMC